MRYSLQKESADEHEYILTVTVPSTRKDPFHATLVMENERLKEVTQLAVNYDLFDHPTQETAHSYEPEPRRMSALWSFLIVLACATLAIWFLMVKVCKKDPID